MKTHTEKLNELLHTFCIEAHKKMGAAVRSGGVPESWMTDDSYLLAKAAIDSLCRDRPFRPMSPDHTPLFNNLHTLI